MRSGTTLMGAILNAHPDIDIVSDTLTWFFKRCYKQFGSMESLFEFENMFYQMEPFMKHHKNCYDYNSLKSQLSTKDHISYSNIYKSLIELETKRALNKFYGVKTTHASFEYEKIIDFDSKTKIIHMVRDIHDVYSSHARFVNKSKINKIKKIANSGINLFSRKKYSIDERYFRPFHFKEPEKIIDYWCVSNRKAIDLANACPKNIKIIKYEDLLTSTEQTLKDVISFIGAEWNDDFYKYSNLKDRGQSKWSANSSFNDTDVDNYDKSIIGRGKKTLSILEKQKISERCAGLLETFNYKI